MKVKGNKSDRIEDFYTNILWTDKTKVEWFAINQVQQITTNTSNKP